MLSAVPPDPKDSKNPENKDRKRFEDLVLAASLRREELREKHYERDHQIILLLERMREKLRRSARLL